MCFGFVAHTLDSDQQINDLHSNEKYIDVQTIAVERKQNDRKKLEIGGKFP